MTNVSTLKDFFLTLLLKVCWAAALAALLVRFRSFCNLLFTETRNSQEKAKLLLFVTPPLALGVVLRIVGHYQFFDLMLEGSFLMGIVGGRMVGLLGGSLISLPAFGMHEWLSTPVAAFVGLLAGVVRNEMPEKEDIWRFGPFLWLNIPQSVWKLLRYNEGNWAILPLLMCAAFESGRILLVTAIRRHPTWLMAEYPPNSSLLILEVFASVICVGVAIKIWNNTRTEMNLAQNQQMLLKARMDALTSQINPHFLFNTLNTVSSLIRIDQDQARGVVLRLSKILRRLLRKHEMFVPLREELDFIDDYLSIEMIRFGHDKLQFFKETDEASLDAVVPSMLLQPMVENAIKHGIAPRLEGGQIYVRAHVASGRLALEIEDNGIGIPHERLGEVYGGGIGISNVNERLRLLYGDQFKMDIRSQEGKGTIIHIELPEVASVASQVT